MVITQDPPVGAEVLRPAPMGCSLGSPRGPKVFPFPTPAPHFPRPKSPSHSFFLPVGGSTHLAKPDLRGQRPHSSAPWAATRPTGQESQRKMAGHVGTPPTSNKPLGALLPRRMPLEQQLTVPDHFLDHCALHLDDRTPCNSRNKPTLWGTSTGFPSFTW